jgi:RimJ/RimL family protein N-acetyltransferase
MSTSVRLRPYQISDLPQLHAAIVESQAEVRPWLPDLLGGLDPAGLHAWLDAQAGDRMASRAYHFAIVSTSDDGFLGGCGLTNPNRRHQFANLYYWVRSSAAGQGVASAAVRLAARFAFAELGLQRVEIVVDRRNLASLRAAEKSGATREGLLRNRLRTTDEACDAYMFSLIPEDMQHP